MHLRAATLEATRAIAAVMASAVRAGDVIVLAGDMGAGKTAFAQGFAAALGVDEPVTSPTFTLVHTYDTERFALHHADLYRLDRMAEVADLALHELVDDDGVLLVEWGDVVPGLWREHLVVTLVADAHDDDVRHLTVRAVGTGWGARWERLQQSLAPWAVEVTGSAG